MASPPGGNGEAGVASPPAPSGGLVNTVTSHSRPLPSPGYIPPSVGRRHTVTCGDVTVPKAVFDWQKAAADAMGEGRGFPDFNRWYSTQLRLHKMRRRTLTRSRVQAQEVISEMPEHSVQFVTFTYAPGHAWDPRHISVAVQCYRDQSRRDGVPLRYEWVAELQLGRMARYGHSAEECMHYHLMVWQPAGYHFPMPDRRGWWRHGMTQTEVARNPVGYLAKYASKGAGDEALPRRARISGGGGLSAVGAAEVRWWLLPRYVREKFPQVGADVRRARGGGWVNWDDGEFLPAVQIW